MTFIDLKPLFDFSLFETAIAQFAADPVAGGGLFAIPPDEDDPNRANWNPGANIPFLTAVNSLVFQKWTPRVSMLPVSYTPNYKQLVQDANGVFQNSQFTVPITFFVITKAHYKFHSDLCTTWRALVSTMNPVAVPGQIQTTGLNAFLKYHELGQIRDAGNTLNIGETEPKGFYISEIKYNATFAVRAAAWPGGTLTA